MIDLTTHDIEANGKTYILEWTHSDEGKGYITITETCDRSNEETEDEPGYDCEHETYDFTEVE